MGMIDTGEAVRCLDLYSDDLVSLGLLVVTGTLNDKTDDEMCEVHEGLKNAIYEKQKEAITLAHDIVATKHRRRAGSDSRADALRVSAAVQRCVLAINEANVALKGRITFDDRMAAKEQEAEEKEVAEQEAQEIAVKETEAKQAAEANFVAESALNDPAV
jgi:hypothetical protein